MTSQETRGRTIAECGERELIQMLTPFCATPGGDILVGIGDDASVTAFMQSATLREVLTTDLLIENTHFLRRPDTDWEALGHKAITANLSDIAAMGARPTWALVSLGLPADLPVDAVLNLYKGMKVEAARTGCAIVGGDIAKSPHIVMNLAVGGVAPREQTIPLRSNCRPGQNVYVTGALGGSKAGLELLLRDSSEVPQEDWVHRLIQRHLRPSARTATGTALARAFPDLAMIDVSDSLANELGLLAAASDCGYRIQLTSLPAHTDLDSFISHFGGQKDSYVISSGEEYELLFTAIATSDAVNDVIRNSGNETTATMIGTVTNGTGAVFVDGSGNERALLDETYKHFTGSNG